MAQVMRPNDEADLAALIQAFGEVDITQEGYIDREAQRTTHRTRLLEAVATAVTVGSISPAVANEFAKAAEIQIAADEAHIKEAHSTAQGRGERFVGADSFFDVPEYKKLASLPYQLAHIFAASALYDMMEPKHFDNNDMESRFHKCKTQWQRIAFFSLLQKMTPLHLPSLHSTTHAARKVLGFVGAVVATPPCLEHTPDAHKLSARLNWIAISALQQLDGTIDSDQARPLFDAACQNPLFNLEYSTTDATQINVFDSVLLGEYCFKEAGYALQSSPYDQPEAREATSVFLATVLRVHANHPTLSDPMPVALEIARDHLDAGDPRVFIAMARNYPQAIDEETITAATTAALTLQAATLTDDLPALEARQASANANAERNRHDIRESLLRILSNYDSGDDRLRLSTAIATAIEAVPPAQRREDAKMQEALKGWLPAARPEAQPATTAAAVPAPGSGSGAAS